MTWYQNLYTGPLAMHGRDRIIEDVDSGLYPPKVFLLTVSDTGKCQMDIIEAKELRHDHIREHCALIVGLAVGRSEAVSVLMKIVRDVYKDTGDADIKMWLSKEH